MNITTSNIIYYNLMSPILSHSFYLLISYRIISMSHCIIICHIYLPVTYMLIHTKIPKLLHRLQVKLTIQFMAAHESTETAKPY